jgi:hypothetical protein
MKNKTKFNLITMLMVISLFSVVATAQDESGRIDVMQKDAERILRELREYTIFDLVSVSIDDQRLMLNGLVTNGYKKNKYLRELEQHLSEVEIVNNIDVLPASIEDSRLRSLLARSIYYDSHLFHYASPRGPYPIHIIVSGSRVTLEGNVNNEMDKRLVYSKARNIFGVITVENNLTTR